MMRITIIVAAFVLTGCGITPQGSIVRAMVSEGGAKVMDTALKNLEWGICNGISIGAVRRHYKGARAADYRNFCRPVGSVIDDEEAP